MSRPVLIRRFYSFTEWDFNRFLIELWDQIQAMMAGKTDNKGDVTLTDSSATTTVDHAGFESDMAIFFTPLTANAAAEIGAGTMYVSSRVADQFVITHANNAQTDRDFVYIIMG